MLTLEQAIASYEKSAERYHKSFLRCKAHGGEFYKEEAESNKICYEHDCQLSEWLRELQERRKQPEIIRCGECKYKKDHHYENPGEEPYIKSTCENKYGLVKNYQVHDWDFCSRAERRTDGEAVSE